MGDCQQFGGVAAPVLHTVGKLFRGKMAFVEVAVEVSLNPVILLQAIVRSSFGQIAAAAIAQRAPCIPRLDMPNSLQRLNYGAPNHFGRAHRRTRNFQRNGIVQKLLGSGQMLSNLRQDLTASACAVRVSTILATCRMTMGNSGKVQANSGS